MNELERVVAEVAATQEASEKAIKRRDDAIRAHLTELGATAVSRITGLSRARIYQIAERRR